MIGKHHPVENKDSLNTILFEQLLLMYCVQKMILKKISIVAVLAISLYRMLPHTKFEFGEIRTFLAICLYFNSHASASAIVLKKRFDIEPSYFRPKQF